MTLSNLFNINVFTAMDGTIMLDGKAVSGVKVILNTRIVFNNRKISSSTKTDHLGRFHFDAIFSNSINSILPSAKIIDQEIILHYRDKQYLAWKMVKNNYKYNGELNDLSKLIDESDVIPLILTCDLENENITRKAGTHEHVALTGICRWIGESSQ
ncbi:MAG: hypothetical protein KUG53_01545 [Pseudomonadales bacterium]|nr:hypothetical protein [Pseudomonadales bacterium]